MHDFGRWLCRKMEMSKFLQVVCKVYTAYVLEFIMFYYKVHASHMGLDWSVVKHNCVT